MIFSPPLVKAARALLEWDQRDLAAASGLSMTAINNFERGLGRTRPATLDAIKSALEDHGIEFPASGGLRRIDDVTRIFRHTGPDFVTISNREIYATLRKPRSEILTCSVDDTLWFSPQVKETNAEFNAWRKKLDIRGKTLVPEENLVFNEPRHQYRVLPSPLIGKITYVIFADRISFLSWRKKQVLIIRDKSIVDTFREQFTYLWSLGKKP